MILATETEGLSRLFDLDFQLLADASLMIIAMFFLFMFASHYLFNPVRKMLQDRQKSTYVRNAFITSPAPKTRLRLKQRLGLAGISSLLPRSTNSHS